MAFLLDRDIYEVPATPPFVRASRPQNPSMETTIRLSTKVRFLFPPRHISKSVCDESLVKGPTALRPLAGFGRSLETGPLKSRRLLLWHIKSQQSSNPPGTKSNGKEYAPNFPVLRYINAPWHHCFQELYVSYSHDVRPKAVVERVRELMPYAI